MIELDKIDWIGRVDQAQRHYSRSRGRNRGRPRQHQNPWSQKGWGHQQTHDHDEGPRLNSRARHESRQQQLAKAAARLVWILRSRSIRTTPGSGFLACPVRGRPGAGGQSSHVGNSIDPSSRRSRDRATPTNPLQGLAGHRLGTKEWANCSISTTHQNKAARAGVCCRRLNRSNVVVSCPWALPPSASAQSQRQEEPSAQLKSGEAGRRRRRPDLDRSHIFFGAQPRSRAPVSQLL